MTKKNYCITTPAWGINRIGLEDIPKEYWLAHFWALVDFLQAHNLTTKKLFASKDLVMEDSKLMAEDVNDIGLELLRVGLDRWHKANDDYPKYLKLGITVKPLENALKKILSEHTA